MAKDPKMSKAAAAKLGGEVGVDSGGGESGAKSLARGHPAKRVLEAVGVCLPVGRGPLHAAVDAREVDRTNDARVA